MRDPRMPDFIETLYEDQISVSDRYPYDRSVYEEKAAHLIKMEYALRGDLTPHQLSLLESYIDAEADLRHEELMARFVMGFRLGGQCIYDVFLSPQSYPSPRS